MQLAGSYLASHQEDAADYLAWLETTPPAALHFGERQRESIPLLLERSVEQLSKAARDALGVAGQLSLEPFSRDAVAAALGVSAREAGRLLAESVNCALLNRPTERYQVTHVLIHSYARSRIAVAPEAMGNLAVHYAALAREQTPEGAAGFAVLDAERLHAMAVLRACQDGEQWEALQDLAGAVGGYLDRQGHWTDLERTNEARLAAARALGEPGDEAAALNNLGLVYAAKGEWEQAIGMYEQSLELEKRVGDVHGMAQTLGNIGVVYAVKGEWKRAIRMYEQSLEIKERVGDVHGMAQTLGNLGLVYAAKGDWERAIGMYEQSLEINERVGDVHGMAQTYNNLGSVYYRKGEWERAIGMYEQSLETKERVGDVHGMAQTVGNLGNVYADQGDWERAIGMYKRSLEVTETMGDWSTSANLYFNLGSLYSETGEPEKAKPLFARAYLIFDRIGAPDGDDAFSELAGVCGSEEAAHVYLATFTSEQPDEG